MQRIIEENKQKLIELCKKYDVQSMYVFGSASSEDFKESSDIDILIAFKKDISIERYTDNYFELHYKLEELFNRKVDLITENSLSNPYFIERVEENSELVFCLQRPSRDGLASGAYSSNRPGEGFCGQSQKRPWG